MSWFVEHWIASSLLVIYVSVLFHNAYVGNKAATGVGGYYVGNRQLGGTVVGISFFATFASTNTFIGHAGKGYDYGIAWFTMAVLLVIFSWISWRWIGPPLRRFAAAWDALTIPDYIRGRILGNNPDAERHPLLLLSASVIVFASILYLLAIFKGAGHLFQIFLGVPYEVGGRGYLTRGGALHLHWRLCVRHKNRCDSRRAHAHWCHRQFSTLSRKQRAASRQVAQLTDMPAKEHLFDLNGAVPFAVLLGVSLSGALKLIVDPRQLSRFYGLKSDAEVKRGMWIAVLGMTLILACMFPIGLYAHLILDNVTDTDLIVPRLVNDPAIFPFWVTDLLIVSIVSAAMSSMDSVLLVASSTLYKNIIAPFKAIENEVRWSRAAVIGFACVSAFMALNPPGDIVGITIFSGSLYAVCFFPPVVFGLHGRIASARTTLMSMILGMSTLILWITLGLSALLHEVFPALLMSASVYWFQSSKETTTKI
jgi:Na+/pantothenate symporter